MILMMKFFNESIEPVSFLVSEKNRINSIRVVNVTIPNTEIILQRTRI